MSDVAVAMLVTIANILGAGMILPQAVRLRRRAPEGVSGAWVGVGITMNGWWLAYGLQGGLLGLIPVSSVAGALYVSIAWQLRRQRGGTTTRDLAIGAAGLGAIPVPFLVVEGWEAAGTAIGLCYGLQFAPAALAAFRSTNLTGIAPTTWSMALLEALIWLLYGLRIDDLPLVIGGLGGGAMALAILTRLFARRLGARRPPARHKHPRARRPPARHKHTRARRPPSGHKHSGARRHRPGTLSPWQCRCP